MKAESPMNVGEKSYWAGVLHAYKGNPLNGPSQSPTRRRISVTFRVNSYKHLNRLLVLQKKLLWSRANDITQGWPYRGCQIGLFRY